MLGVWRLDGRLHAESTAVGDCMLSVQRSAGRLHAECVVGYLGDCMLSARRSAGRLHAECRPVSWATAC